MLGDIRAAGRGQLQVFVDVLAPIFVVSLDLTSAPLCHSSARDIAQILVAYSNTQASRQPAFAWGHIEAEGFPSYCAVPDGCNVGVAIGKLCCWGLFDKSRHNLVTDLAELLKLPSCDHFLRERV